MIIVAYLTFSPYLWAMITNRTMMQLLCIAMILLTTPSYAIAANKAHAKLQKKVEKVFKHYRTTTVADDDARTITITIDDSFADQELTEVKVRTIYRDVAKKVPKAFRSYTITIITKGKSLEEHLHGGEEVTKPKGQGHTASHGGFWGDIDYDGNPWVTNMAIPYEVREGLLGRHIALWASHGMYYAVGAGKWKWQRPELFTTVEDLFTSSITAPYLIPMLENAGAVVFTPRERDYQRHEVIVDNDTRIDDGQYDESSGRYHWQKSDDPGFAYHRGVYFDGENPFTAGTARVAQTTTKASQASSITYRPEIAQAGRYAVYVSYQTAENSIDDAEYTVVHKGVATPFRVNQTMGGGTWVYLGTFDFDEGCNDDNCVVLTNISESKGVVTADAVRFGGGMGNIARGGVVSGMPRYVEGSRYYAQWAGMPYETYSIYKGEDDYKDDINARSTMTNYLGGGSPFMPTRYGLRVPIELSIAIHSDAGYAKDGQSLYGSLAIYTTDFNDGLTDAGVSRTVSGTLAQALLDNLQKDITARFGAWNTRGTYDRNYSETRMPAVPSVILETLSHQNFPDMAWAMDPNFRFTFARSVYKTLLSFIARSHGQQYVVTPLAPTAFRIDMQGDKVTLRWEPVADPSEPTATPSAYVVYTAIDEADFDNGTLVESSQYTTTLQPSTLYSFKVAAVNSGGRSFTTETLSACYNPEATATVMIIDAFHRLASPAVINDSIWQGFNMAEDAGVSEGSTVAFVGAQQVYDKEKMGRNGSSGLGFSGNELAGRVIAGNDHSHVVEHAKAIAAAGYSLTSASSYAVEGGKTSINAYHIVDLILGLERNDGHSLLVYDAISTAMRMALRQYYHTGSGALLVSGAYIGTDADTPEELSLLEDVLHVKPAGAITNYTDSLYGMSTTIPYYNGICEEHYAAMTYDALEPIEPAFAAIRYYGGAQAPAAVAYRSQTFRAFTMGVPFECIRGEQKQRAIMRGILNFLSK